MQCPSTRKRAADAELSDSDSICGNKYAYCPVNVSRAVGPRIVDRVINNLSNDSDM